MTKLKKCMDCGDELPEGDGVRCENCTECNDGNPSWLMGK